MTTLTLAKTATTQDVLKGHTQYTVGDHNFIKLSTDEFLAIAPIPTNRDSIRRVPKMKNIFIEAYENKQQTTLTEVAIGIVSQDFIDPDSNTKYTKGEWYVVDGNTRQHFWRMNPSYAEKLINGITAKIHYLSSMKDVEFAYYPYNNKESVENASEILQGLARRYNWTQPRQTMFRNGGYKTALDWACFIPGVKEHQDIFASFHEMFESIKLLDSIPTNSEYGITQPAMKKDLKSQPIIAACLFMIHRHPTNLRLHDFIFRLSTITHDDLDRAVIKKDGFDPVEVIALEYSNQSYRRNAGRDAQPFLKGLAKSTKHASRSLQMDFLLFWISAYLNDPKKKYKNFPEDMFIGAWDELLHPGDDNE